MGAEPALGKIYAHRTVAELWTLKGKPKAVKGVTTKKKKKPLGWLEMRGGPALLIEPPSRRYELTVQARSQFAPCGAVCCHPVLTSFPFPPSLGPPLQPLQAAVNVPPASESHHYANVFVAVEWNHFIVGRSPPVPVPKLFTQIVIEFDANGVEVVTETVVQVRGKDEKDKSKFKAGKVSK